MHFRKTATVLVLALCVAGTGCKLDLTELFRIPVWGPALRQSLLFLGVEHGFRMRLSAYVPAILAASIEEFVDRLLERNGLRRPTCDRFQTSMFGSRRTTKSEKSCTRVQGSST